MRSRLNKGRPSATLKFLALTSTALVGLVLPSITHAQQWTGQTIDWFDPANWNPTHVPTAADDAIINGGNGLPRASGVGKVANVNQLVVGDTNINTLDVEDGVTLNTNQTILGRQAGSYGAIDVGGIVSPSLATWINQGSLIVGQDGAGTVLISNGQVSTGDSQLGAGSDGYGQAVVTGPTAVWSTASALTIGGAGDGAMIVQSGATVTNDVGYLGHDGTSSGQAQVDGAGSTWTSNSTLFVGYQGDGKLTIANGGHVANQTGTVASEANASGAVKVDGAGSRWDSDQDLFIGRGGHGVLDVLNGAAVTGGTFASIGSQGTSVGAVTIDGPGSTFGVQQALYLGAAGFGGMTVTNGAAVSDDVGYMGYGPTGAGDALIGGGASWTNTSNLFVGYEGDASLTIGTGGLVSDQIGVIANEETSSAAVTVTDAGSTWNNTHDLYVGRLGMGTLNILNGGAVTGGTFGSIGSAATSIGEALVDGTGSSLTLQHELYVGAAGLGTLTIAHGGAVNDDEGYLGFDPNAVGQAKVDGVGSVWTNTSALHVGYAGKGVLDIVNGGVVKTGLTGLAESPDNSGAITVSGTGSALLGSDNLTVGSFGTGVLNIKAGAAVADKTGTLGAAAGSIGTANVDGVGSTWNNADLLLVGSSGAGVLKIANGGLVQDSSGVLGAGVGSNGHLTVDGPGSIWTNDSVTIIGLGGSGRLDVSHGGKVYTGAVAAGDAGAIGSATGATGIAVVDGAGSAWSGTGDLLVGYAGSGALTLSNGGAVNMGGALVIAKLGGSSGDLTIGAGAAPGVVNAGSVQFGDGVGHLTFDHTSANYAFNAALSGVGGLSQAAGVTHLTADSSGFTGTAFVSDGALLVDGALGGGVAVQAGGTLGGTGNIKGGVSVAAGGQLQGMQGQTLSMDQLDLNSGATVQALLDTPGGGALFNIGHDLTLDGTLDITTGGAFGSGVYSLMTYGGVLTDNGLDIGATPDGQPTAYLVQTAVAGQVNLIKDPIANLNFWDGDAAGAAGDNVVNGGSGEWTAVSTNWTSADGSTNGAMAPQPGFAIFQGAAGTVEVDAAAGPIAITGMQFASDGYHLQGSSLTLAQANSVLRVGDGSASGADFKAVVDTALTGSGGLIKTDLGTLILTGDNSYLGGTTIANGTLQIGAGGTTGAIAGDVLANGVLAFDRADLVVFGGMISGVGRVEQRGSGTLNLTGDSSAFSGAVDVSSGRLAVNGSLANAAVNVGAGGVLGGNGVVGTLTAQSGSIVAPGNSIGQLNVAGNVTFASGSTYQVELTGTGTSDRIVASGAATIASGAVLSVIKTDATPYALGTRYSILSASGGVSGGFGFAPVQVSNFIGLVAGTDATGVYVDVAKTKSFASAAATANQAAVGGALDGLPITSDLFVAVANLPTDAAAQGAFDELSGEVHVSVRSLTAEDSRFVRQAANDRLRSAADAEGAQSWGRVYGSWADVDGTEGAAGIQRRIGGMLMGVDATVGDRWTIGGLVGYGRSRFDGARQASGVIDNYDVAAYAGRSWGKLALRTGLAYGWRDVSTRRTAVFAGFGEELKAGYKTRLSQAFGEVAYGAQVGRVALEPFINLAHVHQDAQKVAETGGEAALAGALKSNAQTFTTIGLRAGSTYVLGDGGDLTVHGLAGWRLTSGDETGRASLSFAGGPAFDVWGAAIANTAAVIDLGLTLTPDARTKLDLSYGGQFSSGASDHSVRAALTVRF